jgi:mevalonate kinase
MYTGKGFGKVILFGEHFVVYGLPGIASGISASTSAFVEEGEKGFELIDNRPAAAGYKEKKKEEMKRQIDALLRHFNIEPEKTPLKITLGGNLFCDSGIGASAALATSRGSQTSF